MNLQVTFQKFDKEWEEYVDLESPAVLCHNDKLKAVVTPLLEELKDVSRVFCMNCLIIIVLHLVNYS